MPPTSAGAMEERLRAIAGRERFEFPADVVPSTYRRSAVLIPFWREEDELFVVLTERARRLRSHGGMVSFPGGALEPGETWVEAAVREAHEEIGLNPNHVEVLGLLDDAWSSAKHHLVPVVAWLEERPSLVANPDEVARIMFAGMSEILHPEARSEETVYLGTVPCINVTIKVSSGRIFGLTADLLLEAVEWAAGGSPERGRTRLRELEAKKAMESEDKS